MSDKIDHMHHRIDYGKALVLFQVIKAAADCNMSNLRVVSYAHKTLKELFDDGLVWIGADNVELQVDHEPVEPPTYPPTEQIQAPEGTYDGR